MKSFKAAEFSLKKWEGFCTSYSARFPICSRRHDKYRCDKAVIILKIRPSLRSWGFALCLLACVWGFVGSLVWLFGIFLQKQFLIDNVNIEDGLSSLGLILLSHLIKLPLARKVLSAILCKVFKQNTGRFLIFFSIFFLRLVFRV